jgi:hypothetical protein
MKTDAVFTRPMRAEETSRQIALRTRGHSHGRVTRLVSPGDIGERIRPFVFLDYFDADPATAPKFGFHPHSGNCDSNPHSVRAGVLQGDHGTRRRHRDRRCRVDARQ